MLWRPAGRRILVAVTLMAEGQGQGSPHLLFSLQQSSLCAGLAPRCKMSAGFSVICPSQSVGPTPGKQWPFQISIPIALADYHLNGRQKRRWKSSAPTMLDFIACPFAYIYILNIMRFSGSPWGIVLCCKQKERKDPSLWSDKKIKRTKGGGTCLIQSFINMSHAFFIELCDLCTVFTPVLTESRSQV